MLDQSVRLITVIVICSVPVLNASSRASTVTSYTLSLPGVGGALVVGGACEGEHARLADGEVVGVGSRQGPGDGAAFGVGGPEGVQRCRAVLPVGA